MPRETKPTTGTLGYLQLSAEGLKPRLHIAKALPMPKAFPCWGMEPAAIIFNLKAQAPWP